MADAQLLLEGRSGAVEIVDRLVRRAAAAGASDLHFVPQPDGMLVRIRVDGVLHDADRVSSTVGTTLAARIKVMARLDVADREKAQDGRFATDNLDIRVSVLPTVLGEGLILRLLRTDAMPPSLTNLGLDNEMQMNLERILSRPHGLLVVAGPTGAGKSTTLYAALDDVNSPEVNIVTVEDPVEYRVERAYQVQVNEKRGLTFPTALRSILRSDPDIIMVGEIRDSETAQLVLEASLSGHLVLSTLHSDDSPRALTRLAELGAATHLLSSAVTAILSQRLARRLCPVCREAYTPAPTELDLLGWDTSTEPDEVNLYRARGCEECMRGYAGRIGIFQLMLMSDDISAALRQSGAHTAADAAATRGGMRTLWEDGARKVQAGLTSFEELRRVVL
jgi:type IV pilus assembly protein PilB